MTLQCRGFKMQDDLSHVTFARHLTNGLNSTKANLKKKTKNIKTLTNLKKPGHRKKTTQNKKYSVPEISKLKPSTTNSIYFL